MLFQYRLLLGGRFDLVGSDRGKDGGTPGPLLGGRCVSRGDPVLARGHPVCSDVRPDRAGADLHDPRLRGQEQREHHLRHHADATARSVEGFSISLSCNHLD